MQHQWFAKLLFPFDIGKRMSLQWDRVSNGAGSSYQPIRETGNSSRGSKRTPLYTFCPALNTDRPLQTRQKRKRSSQSTRNLDIFLPYSSILVSSRFFSCLPRPLFPVATAIVTHRKYAGHPSFLPSL